MSTRTHGDMEEYQRGHYREVTVQISRYVPIFFGMDMDDIPRNISSFLDKAGPSFNNGNRSEAVLAGQVGGTISPYN
jgi:hypothetical protein